MNIRKIKKEDNLLLAKMIRAVFEEHDAPRMGTVYSDPTTDNLYNLFQAGRSVLWVAELDSEIVGCCGIYPTEGLPQKCAELVKFYLHEKSRGQGIGRKLMEKCIESAKEFQYTTIYLESFSQFSKAIVIYEKQGFETLGAPMGNSGHTSCNIWMIKKL
jgi:putative acetyltransferase